MWAIKWFLAVILILLVLGFALQNSNQPVTVKLGMYEFQQVQLWMVIYSSFALGVLFWLVVSVFQVFQLKSEIRRLKKQNAAIQNELDDLRNLPIEDDEAELGIREEDT